MVVVRPGRDFAVVSATEYVVRPEEPDDYQAVLEAVADHPSPLGVVHAWALEAPGGDTATERFESARGLGFGSGLALVQSLQAAGVGEQALVWFLGAGFESVDDEPVLTPAAATLRGLALVAPAECPGLRAGTIDVGPAARHRAWSRPLSAKCPPDVPRHAWRCVAAICSSTRLRWRHPPSRPHRRCCAVRGRISSPADLAEWASSTRASWPREYRARLSLVSRRGMSASHAADVVRELEALGGQAMVLQADVTDAASMKRAVADTRGRYGHIDGVFHAAGVLEPALIPLLAPDDAARAMAAKTLGTIALEAALADDPPELLLLFSSISALVGIPGQAAYAGASAFLNAVAATAAPSGQRRIAIDFGPWRGAGMTARAGRSESTDASTSGPLVHPLVGRRAADAGAAEVFTASYRPADLWVLGEHAVHGGPAVLPGAAVFETVSAVLGLGSAPDVHTTCTIEDLAFVEPLAVARDGEAAVLVSLTPSDGAFRYALESQLPGSERREHVSALVRRGGPDPPVVDLAAVRARCTGNRGLDSNDPLRHQARTMEFGPRWKSHLDVRYGSDEALAEVRAADATAGDQAYAWHPAIVDVAMTAGLAMAPAGGGDATLLWVPAGCDVVTLWSPPGPRLLAHARFRRAGLTRSGRRVRRNACWTLPARSWPISPACVSAVSNRPG